MLRRALTSAMACQSARSTPCCGGEEEEAAAAATTTPCCGCSGEFAAAAAAAAVTESGALVATVDSKAVRLDGACDEEPPRRR